MQHSNPIDNVSREQLADTRVTVQIARKSERDNFFVDEVASQDLATVHLNDFVHEFPT